jgi:hypothetical protein
MTAMTLRSLVFLIQAPTIEIELIPEFDVAARYDGDQ